MANSLVLLIRDAGDFGDPGSRGLLRRKLLADENVSMAFGLSGCETSEEVGSLISIYRHLTSRKDLLYYCNNGSTKASLKKRSLPVSSLDKSRAFLVTSGF